MWRITTKRTHTTHIYNTTNKYDIKRKWKIRVNVSFSFLFFHTSLECELVCVFFAICLFHQINEWQPENSFFLERKKSFTTTIQAEKPSPTALHPSLYWNKAILNKKKTTTKSFRYLKIALWRDVFGSMSHPHTNPCFHPLLPNQSPFLVAHNKFFFGQTNKLNWIEI